VHQCFVGDIAVGKDHLINPLASDQLGQHLLRKYGNAAWVESAGQGGRIAPVADARDLGGGEGDHPGGRIILEDAVEVVKIPPGGPHDEDPGLLHLRSIFVFLSPSRPVAGRWELAV